jgi:hypothetical protein
VANRINEQQHEFEAAGKVLEIYEMFGKQLEEGPGTLKQFVRSYRRFVREGVLKKDNGKKYTCFLFNDILVCVMQRGGGGGGGGAL